MINSAGTGADQSPSSTPDGPTLSASRWLSTTQPPPASSSSTIAQYNQPSPLGMDGVSLTRAGGATALREIEPPFVLQLLLGVRWGARWGPQPLEVVTALDLQHPTQTTAQKLRRLRLYPGTLHSSWCAQDAAAFFQSSRSSCKRAFSFRRPFSSSYRCTS
jgi:hypothetical protein